MYSLPLLEEDRKKILEKLKNKEFSEEELEELLPLVPYLGLPNQTFIVEDQNSPEAVWIKDYMDFHKTLPREYEHIPIDEIKKMSDILFDPDFDDWNRHKEIIILLGHHGTKEALDILEKYLDQPHGDELAFWASVAIDECKMFLDSKKTGESQARFTKIC
ncbi:MAG: hypothetical protein WC460_05180 [Patescibacteria group bacterium]